MSVERARQLIAIGQADMAAGQADYEAWKEGSANKVALHAVVGALQASLGGSSPAGGSGRRGRRLESARAITAGLSPELQQWASVVIGAAAGAVVSGGGLQATLAAGVAGLTGEQYNRALHPEAAKELTRFTNRVASQSGFSTQQVEVMTRVLMFNDQYKDRLQFSTDIDARNAGVEVQRIESSGVTTYVQTWSDFTKPLDALTGEELRRLQETVLIALAEDRTKLGMDFQSVQREVPSAAFTLGIPLRYATRSQRYGRGSNISETSSSADAPSTASQPALQAIVDMPIALPNARSALEMRVLPGRASGGLTLPDVKGDWLLGSDGNAGYIPGQIARKLNGETFGSFDDFRSAFWKSVAADTVLSSQFITANVARMKNGLAPFAPASQTMPGRQTYILRRRTPINQGGPVYDMNNLLVVTPRYHAEVLDPQRPLWKAPDVIRRCVAAKNHSRFASRASGQTRKSTSGSRSFRENLPHPSVSDLIFFHIPELTAEEVLRIARSYKPIIPPAELPRLNATQVWT